MAGLAFITSKLRLLKDEEDRRVKLTWAAFVCPLDKFTLPAGLIVTGWQTHDTVYGFCKPEPRIRLHTLSALLPAAQFYSLKVAQRNLLLDVAKSDQGLLDKTTAMQIKQTSHALKLLSAATTLSEKELTRECFQGYLASLRL